MEQVADDVLSVAVVVEAELLEPGGSNCFGVWIRFRDERFDMDHEICSRADSWDFLTAFVRSWRVFPVHGVVRGQCTCGRLACSSPGKHPLTRHGLKDATCDIEVIAEWWSRWPAANIGIATGESGIVVIDINLPLALASLDVVLHKLPRTLTSLTGGGGLHLLYRGRFQQRLRNRTSSLPGMPDLPGIDLRADGGYGSTDERCARFARREEDLETQNPEPS